MRTFTHAALLLLTLTIPVVLLGEGHVPTPESVFGFRPGADYKLEPDKASIIMELTFEDKSTIKIVVGASYLRHGNFATSDQWPGTIFFVGPNFVEPILSGTGHFSKERIGVD